jgi:putative Mg2+ transporter-C (MgtC) family protein
MLEVLGLMAAAYALALPVAFEREHGQGAVGLRTFPLVAVTSCAFLLFGERSFGGSPEAQARVLQGLMTGMGFIGGGAILKEGGHVVGLATAASLWSTGGVGAAVAYRRWELAVSLSLLNLLTLRVLTPLKRRIEDRPTPSPSGGPAAGPPPGTPR